MNDAVSIIIDSKEIKGRRGQTIMAAADEADIYIPRLCAKEGLEPYGACRVCTVIVNGRPQAACTTPIAEGMIIENDTEKVLNYRRSIIEMLFVEGNHFCMFCEKSGDCELQALAYRFGIMAPRYPYMFPKREVDSTHPDVLLERHRCVLCARCIRASRDVDEKNVFGFIGRGTHKKIGVNSATDLADTDIDLKDKAVEICPVGTIVKKRTGYAVPIGKRTYDHKPIGSEIEARKNTSGK